MDKKSQAITNDVVVMHANKCLQEYNAQKSNYCIRLRTCQAWIFPTQNYYILCSYNTPIACIEKATGCCFDFLRYVYGYTATSAQHIAKFRNDYGTGKSMMWREI